MTSASSMPVGSIGTCHRCAPRCHRIADSGDLDINGWDLRKALNLLIKPNPVLLEWLRSPVVYRADRAAMDRLAALGERTAHLRPSTHHYLHLCRSQYRRFIDGKDEVAVKKYFYALRPRWR